VASSFAVGSSRLGAAVRAAAARAEVPGFFALAAEAPPVRGTCYRAVAIERSPGSLRPSAGGANEEAMPRARDVTPLRGPPVSTPACLVAEPGSRVPDGVFSAAWYRDPTRLPRIQSTAGGPAAEARSSGQRFAGRIHRVACCPPFGILQALGTFARSEWRSAPSGPLTFLSLGDVLLVRPLGFPWTHRLDASNPLLQPTSRSRAPVAKTPSSETLRGAPWETRRRYASRSSTIRGGQAFVRGRRRTTSRSSGLRQPRAWRHAAGFDTNRHCRLRSRAGRGERGSFFGCAAPRRSYLWRLSCRLETGARALLSSTADPASAGSTSMRARLHGIRGAFRRGGPDRIPSRALAWSATPAGRRARLLHVFIEVRKLRLDHWSTAFAGPFWPRAPPRLLQNRCFNEHCPGPPEHPAPAVNRGRDGCLWGSIVASRSATAEGTRGQGPRTTEPRRSLPGLLPEETLPQPRSLQTPRVAGIACQPAWRRRGRLTMPPARRTLARHARREGRATPDLREEIRRSPTRGAFRRKAVRGRGGRSIGVSQGRADGPAPFSPPGDRARDARAGPESSAGR